MFVCFPILLLVCFCLSTATITGETRSHPEMVGNMSHVTLNFDLSKIPFVHSYAIHLYTHTKN